MLQTVRMRNGNGGLQLGSVALLDANVLVGAANERRRYDSGLVSGIRDGNYGTPVAIADVTLKEAELVCSREGAEENFERVWGWVSNGQAPCLYLDTGLSGVWTGPTSVVTRELLKYEASVKPAYRQLVQRMPLISDRLRSSYGDRIVVYAALYLRERVAGSVSLLTWDSDFNVIDGDLEGLGIDVCNTREHLTLAGIRPRPRRRPLHRERVDGLRPAPETLAGMPLPDALAACGFTVKIVPPRAQGSLNVGKAHGTVEEQ